MTFGLSSMPACLPACLPVYSCNTHVSGVMYGLLKADHMQEAIAASDLEISYHPGREVTTKQ